MAEERLQKILSRAGIASRRTAEALILEGRVQVNGRTVTELGTKADPSTDMIRVDDRVIAEPEELVYLALYKPEKVVTTLRDPEGRPCVGDLLRASRLKVYPVGRLDYDAEGLLLLTNDGALAHKLTHPRWGVRRTYLAKVKGEPSASALEQMKQGVRLEDGMGKALEAVFEKRTQKNTWIRIVVAEGRHHFVKRLCEAVGHPVARLFRSEYGSVTLGGLKAGEFRALQPREVQALRHAVHKEAEPPAGGRRPRRPSGAVRDPILGRQRPAKPKAPRSTTTGAQRPPGEAPTRKSFPGEGGRRGPEPRGGARSPRAPSSSPRGDGSRARSNGRLTPRSGRG